MLIVDKEDILFSNFISILSITLNDVKLTGNLAILLVIAVVKCFVFIQILALIHAGFDLVVFEMLAMTKN